jgi:hypothetical protein
MDEISCFTSILQILSTKSSLWPMFLGQIINPHNNDLADIYGLFYRSPWKSQVKNKWQQATTINLLEVGVEWYRAFP